VLRQDDDFDLLDDESQEGGAEIQEGGATQPEPPVSQSVSGTQGVSTVRRRDAQKPTEDSNIDEQA